MTTGNKCKIYILNNAGIGSEEISVPFWVASIDGG